MQKPAQHYLWAQRPAGEVDLVRMVASVQERETRGDGALSRPVYDVPHVPRPWGGKVSAYLWTKSVAAGALMVAALAALGGRGAMPLTGVLAPLIALVFLALTTALLVLDLKRPDRFHYILFKPNPTSWLVWGAWILMAYGALAVVWLAGGLAQNHALLRALAIPALLLGGGAAGYSAFLFGQAEGRDFWQSPLVLPHLLVGALVAGAAALAIFGAMLGISVQELWTLSIILVLGLIAHAVILVAELGGAHPNLDVARAAHLITRGPWRGSFWGLVVIAGLVLPIALALVGPLWSVAAAVLALAGLWVYEVLWVKAGQSIPLS
jgi:formate-dependent nitrite reductase membrane component NrfD